MNMRECKHCDLPFDLEGFAKKHAGGKINECPDCVEELGTETAVKYLGLSSGDGKASAISIVAFESNEDRNAYSSAWKDNTGFNGGYGGHLSSSNSVLSGRPVRHVAFNAANPNHKGKS